MAAVYMSYSLNSSKGLCRDHLGDYYRAYLGDTRSSDYSSYEFNVQCSRLGFEEGVEVKEGRCAAYAGRRGFECFEKHTYHSANRCCYTYDFLRSNLNYCLGESFQGTRDLTP